MSFKLEMVCRGCGATPDPSSETAFKCSLAESEKHVDHVLRRRLSSSLGKGLSNSFSTSEIEADFDSQEQNPFVRFRRLLTSYQIARSHGSSDADWVLGAHELDRKIAKLDGQGFLCTPYESYPELARAIGLEKIWVKNETGNVSGSHKARHFMGLALWIDAIASIGSHHEMGRLAIASCGNAALGGAIVARAAGWPLDVYVPQSIHAAVSKRLLSLDASLVMCDRESGDEPGDPCYLGFRDAVKSGAFPFTCQGNENGVVIEGGQTLIWEMISEMRSSGAGLDRIFVQVGGGALATACIQGLVEARELGLIKKVPVFHAVQTEGAWPLRRAWRGLIERVLSQMGATIDCDDEEAARLVKDTVPMGLVSQELDYAVKHRHEFMWPWENEPRSVATGILDDETYDWLPIVEGMIRTGGWPLVVGEATLSSAHEIAKKETSIMVDPTGTAGLAGLLAFLNTGRVEPKEDIAVLFTGVERR